MIDRSYFTLYVLPVGVRLVLTDPDAKTESLVQGNGTIHWMVAESVELELPSVAEAVRVLWEDGAAKEEIDTIISRKVVM